MGDLAQPASSLCSPVVLSSWYSALLKTGLEMNHDFCTLWVFLGTAPVAGTFSAGCLLFMF